jgi:hypothetical protein
MSGVIVIFRRTVRDCDFEGRTDPDSSIGPHHVNLHFSDRPECRFVLHEDWLLMENLFIAPRARDGQVWRLVDRNKERRLAWVLALSMPIGVIIGLVAAWAGRG